MRHTFLFVASIVALAACSNPNVADPPYDPSGSWSGSWTSEDGSASGSIVLEFFLDPETGGSRQVVHLGGLGASCGAQGDAGDGSYSAEPASVSFFVNIRDAASPSTDSSGASFTARVEGGSLVGSYTTIAFGNCQFCGCAWGPRGAWSAARAR